MMQMTFIGTIVIEALVRVCLLMLLMEEAVPGKERLRMVGLVLMEDTSRTITTLQMLE